MAMALGFIVVFCAGLAGAYFAGLQAARCRMPTTPTQSSAAKQGDGKSKSDCVDPVEAVATAESASAAALGIDLAAGQASGEGQGATESDSFDTRRFKRLAFSGTAQATIYPLEQAPGCEPIRCEVLTRDLSCGGIGIAHTERLAPQQMVVLDAVGKLLISEVRWCRRVDKGFYVAGCRLIKIQT